MERGGSDIEIRPYEETDEPAVLGLLSTCLGPGPIGTRSPEFFRWKHFANPFGPSLMLVAEAQRSIVGLRAFMRWRFEVGGREVRAVRAVDTATHPRHQGVGIFSRLTQAALESLRADTDLVFNTPNEKSKSGYLKMGWVEVCHVPVRILVKRPAQFARFIRSARETEETVASQPPVDAPSAQDVLARDRRIPSFVAASEGTPDRLATPRTVDYLVWRYASAPALGYHAVVDERDGRLQGIGIFRTRFRGRSREATVGEVLVGPGDTRAAGRVLRRIAKVSDVDHLACSFPAGTAALAGTKGPRFFSAPGGMSLVTREVNGTETIDPFNPKAWALSIGDLEIF